MDDEKHNEGNGERPRIKVTDRRKFKADGSPREADAEPPQAPADGPTEVPIVGGAPEAGQRPAGTPDGAAAVVPPEPQAAPSEAAPSDAASSEPAPPEAGLGDGQHTRITDLPRDFTAFVEGMYLEAMLYLGAIPDPRTGETAEDLDMAKYKIDLLGLLQAKTKGNLTSEESQQLEEVLYQVRMFYVQKTGGKPSNQG